MIARISDSRLLLVLVIGLAGAASFGQESRPAEDPVPRDILGAMIELARRADPSFARGPVRAQLDVFELDLRERLAARWSAHDRVRVLSDYFFREQKFTASADLADPGNFYLHKVLPGRQGYCLSLSAVILTVGRRLGLPLHGVAAPRHFFVRWDDGTTRLNIETTEDGRQRPDEFYRARGISPDAEKGGAYLRNLTDAEVVAWLLNNDGYVNWTAGRGELASRRFDEALALHPDLLEAAINAGIVAAERGDRAGADARFRAVLKFMPDDLPTRINRSLVAIKDERFRDALVELDGLNRASGALAAAQREMVMATVLRPETWRRYQLQVQRDGEALRQTRRLARGLAATYFPRPDLSGEPRRRIDRAVDFEWRWDSPIAGIPADDFSARWEGYVDLPSDGAWSFLGVVNDGIRLWVDDVRLVDDWKENEGAVFQQSLRLLKGLHRVRVEFFERVRFAGITLKVKRADEDRELGPSVWWHGE